MTPPLLAVLLTVAAVTALWWSLPALTQPQLPFGVRVPPHRVADPVITTARRNYTNRLLAFAILVAAAGLPMSMVGPPEPVAAIATTALVVADTAMYLLAHRYLRTAKRVGDWYAEVRQGVTTDLSFRSDPVRVPWRWLTPAAAVLAASTITGLAVAADLPTTLPALDGPLLGPGDRVTTGFVPAATPVLAQAGLCLVVTLTTFGLTRSRPDLDASRPAASARRYRRYLRSLAILLFTVTALANLTLLGVALRLWELVPPAPATSIVVFAPLAATLVAVLVFHLRVGQGGHRLPPEPGEVLEDTGLVPRDDDRHWHLGGFVYINRDDPAIFVPQRVGGARWTVNLGNPIGLTGVCVLVTAGVTVSVLSGMDIIDLPSK